MLSVEKQMEIIKRGVVEIVPEAELVAKLERSVKTGEPLHIKLGLDPTAPDIHLGHTVVLQKIRQFQDLGHRTTIILGDFTARIGDPTGKSETRKQLTEEQVLENAKTYERQIFKVLDPARTTLTFNSKWLSPLNFAQVIELAAKYTVARMLERDDFDKRFKEGLPISVHEFFYPLMQGFDSVALRADVELGGTDQKFNLLMGRTLQREYGQEPQVALMMPIIEGTDGVHKMSKSLGNYIGIDEKAEEMYGKTMSIPDQLMVRYYELLTPVPLDEVSRIATGIQTGEVHPRDVKMRLAREIVSFYHDREAAVRAEEEFKRVFQQHDLPEDMPTFSVSADMLEDGRVWLPKLMQQAGLCSSTSEARRLIQQGAVKVNGERFADTEQKLKPEPGMVIKAGKRKFLRIE
ncbi:MAG TPA: tyrosine--tRNA ligase [Desulfotomaculum sp.]|nr:MAG: tyrosyl-tRNA synthetase [Desulfotomaculum sp. BICA1-6]HBX24560.1 tyrosine--tRNA ligase [Desulfotomaculum sp.]